MTDQCWPRQANLWDGDEATHNLPDSGAPEVMFETAGAELAFGPAVWARSEGGFEVAAHAGGLGEDGTGLYRVPLGCAE